MKEEARVCASIARTRMLVPLTAIVTTSLPMVAAIAFCAKNRKTVCSGAVWQLAIAEVAKSHHYRELLVAQTLNLSGKLMDDAFVVSEVSI